MSSLLKWADFEGHWVYSDEFIALQKDYEKRYFRPFLKELSEWLDANEIPYPERLVALKILLDLLGYVSQGRDLDWILIPEHSEPLEGREIELPQIKRPGKRRGSWQLKKD